MNSGTIVGTRKIVRRVTSIGTAAALLGGAVIMGTSPAQAAAPGGIYSCSSNLFEASAAMSSDGKSGTWRAWARVGSSVKWGASSTTYTAARVTGFSTTNDARIYRNGGIAISC